MAEVWIEPRAEALYGLIQRKYRADSPSSAALETAYYSIIAELRRAHPSIWLVPAEDEDDLFELYQPPLKAYFKRIHDKRIGIVRFVETDD